MLITSVACWNEGLWRTSQKKRHDLKECTASSGAGGSVRGGSRERTKKRKMYGVSGV